MEPVESDPVVSSTVDENDLIAQKRTSISSVSESCPDEETLPQVRRPKWKITRSYTDDTIKKKSLTASSSQDGAEFEVPEFEFYDDVWNMEGSQADDYGADYLATGRITPDGLVDEDFEKELGWLAQVSYSLPSPQAIPLSASLNRAYFCMLFKLLELF
ncbi:unnamed protein product [Dibothriocephalus latus]|uniref:Uncharacterized protein n=1 Tax=Dibothriocephalus latus TaxID=60516 RepID=A0A3P7KVY9_DIBLA|nr:unnamed protein product [Dibothriocephalus latus]